jgi:hypothetical protein
VTFSGLNLRPKPNLSVVHNFLSACRAPPFQIDGNFGALSEISGVLRGVSAVLRRAVDGARRVLAPSGQEIAAIRSGDRTIQPKYQPDGTGVVKLTRGSAYRIEFV